MNLIISLFLSQGFSGYVTSVSEVMNSRNSSNKYFDIRFQTSPVQQERIRTMQNSVVKRQLFNDKKDSATPVTLTSVGTGSNGLRFFNSNRGSTMEDAAATDFRPGQLQHSQLLDLQDVTNGTFTIRGKLKWIKEQELIERKNGTHTVVRDAVIAGGTHSIEISI